MYSEYVLVVNEWQLKKNEATSISLASGVQRGENEVPESYMTVLNKATFDFHSSSRMVTASGNCYRNLVLVQKENRNWWDIPTLQTCLFSYLSQSTCIIPDMMAAVGQTSHRLTAVNAVSPLFTSTVNIYISALFSQWYWSELLRISSAFLSVSTVFTAVSSC